jgi:WS/DGAT/MGAT family acyltransferase
MTQDQPLDWGAPDMNGLEALMWRADADPRLRSTMVAVEILDCEPEWERFLAAHEWGTRMVPRLRQRVIEAPLGIGTPTYATDPMFALRYHVRRQRLSGGGSMRELFDVVAQIGMTPLDRLRPPWEAVLIEGLQGGRAAYALKLHHSTMDGIGTVQLFRGLHSPRRESTPNKPQPAVDVADPGPALELAARKLAADLSGVASAALDPDRIRTLLRPDRSLRDAARYAGSLRRVLADPEAPPSPLLRGRSLTWRLGAIDVPIGPLKAAGQAVAGTLNDAFMAALLGGYRRYHDELGAPVDAIPVAMPISVRRSEDTAGGNRFAAVKLSGPVGLVDPAARVRAVSAIVRAARAEPAADSLGFIAPALARLPKPVLARITSTMAKGSDLQASNIPGLRDEVYFAGARVERLYGFAPLPGCAAMIALISHGDVCCVAVNSDPAAVTDGDRFHRCLREGFDEVLALSGGGARADIVF